MFSLISFLKNFSRMKRWWRKELQLPVTIKRNFLSSYKWKKLFERYRQLPLLPKQILCQSYFTFQIIFTNWIWFVNSFKCFPMERSDLQGKELNYAKELLLNHYKKSVQNFEVTGHVGRVKAVVTNHLRKMFRSRIHKAAERNKEAGMNWNQFLMLPQNFCYWNKQQSADSNIISFHLTLKCTKDQSSHFCDCFLVSKWIFQHHDDRLTKFTQDPSNHWWMSR